MSVTDPDNVRTPVGADAEQSNSSEAPSIAYQDDSVMEGIAKRREEPVDLTIDSEADHARSLQVSPEEFQRLVERTKPANVEVDAATWDDLRALPSPPNFLHMKGDGAKVYVCIAHPNMVVFAPDGQTIVGQFERGYLMTDDSKVQKILEHPSQQYVKRLDLGRL